MRVRSSHCSFAKLHCTCVRWFQTVRKAGDLKGQNAFDVLGLSPKAVSYLTDEDVRRAFLFKAQQLTSKAERQRKRPSTASEDGHSNSVMQLSKAYETLRTQQKRIAYNLSFSASIDDKLGVAVEGDAILTNYNAHHRAFEFSEDTTRSFGDFNDVHKSFTSWDFDPSKFDGKTRAGKDVHHNLRVSLEEALSGCTKTVQYLQRQLCLRCDGLGFATRRKERCTQCLGYGEVELPSGTYVIRRTCIHCKGEGYMLPPKCAHCEGAGVIPGENRLSIDIPAGLSSSSTIRVAGEGDKGSLNGRAGDLVVHLVIEEHRLFHRIGSDFHCAIPITLSTAVLGGVAEVPSLDGPSTEIQIPPLVQSGQVVILPGKGLWSDVSRARGNVVVHLVVITPNGDRLNGAQRRAVEQFSKEDHDGVVSFTGEELSEAKARFSSWLPM